VGGEVVPRWRPRREHPPSVGNLEVEGCNRAHRSVPWVRLWTPPELAAGSAALVPHGRSLWPPWRRSGRSLLTSPTCLMPSTSSAEHSGAAASSSPSPCTIDFPTWTASSLPLPHAHSPLLHRRGVDGVQGRPTGDDQGRPASVKGPGVKGVAHVKMVLAGASILCWPV
jgi:hypothetical protein